MNLGLGSHGLWAGFTGVRNRSRRTWGQVFMNLESAPHGLGIEFTWTWGRVRRDSGWLSYGVLVTFSECPDGCRTNSGWQLQWARQNLVPGFARCLLFRRRIRSILLPPPTNPWKNPAALRGFSPPHAACLLAVGNQSGQIHRAVNGGVVVLPHPLGCDSPVDTNPSLTDSPSRAPHFQGNHILHPASRRVSAR